MLLRSGWRLGVAAAFLHYLLSPHVPPPLRQTARCVLAFLVIQVKHIQNAAADATIFRISASLSAKDLSRFTTCKL